MAIDNALSVALVAPHVGAWIEMEIYRGFTEDDVVAPHVGAWIEIWRTRPTPRTSCVAPHVGAWIEIARRLAVTLPRRSHPTRVRGLKFILATS